VKFLFQENDDNYDSLDIDENYHYCAEHMLIFENFIGFFYSHSYDENVDISLATFSTDGKFIDSQTLGTDYEFSNDYSSFSSSTIYQIESKNIHVTNISTQIGLNDTVNEVDSTVTKSLFTFKYGRIRKIKEILNSNSQRKFYRKFKPVDFPLTIKKSNDDSRFLQKNEIVNLLKQKGRNYQAQYILKSEKFITLIYSHKHNDKGYEVTDILMSTFLNNGRLNDTKLLGTEYVYNDGEDTHFSSFEIKIDSVNLEVKNLSFKKSNKAKNSEKYKTHKSSNATYILDQGFIIENGKTSFNAFCEKFKPIDLSKTMEWFYDRPPYIQDAELKTFLNIETPTNNQLQYYKAEYILKSENMRILIYSQTNGQSENKYSDVYMSTFSQEGKLIDTQFLGTNFEQNKGKYTHISSTDIKVNPTTVNVVNVTYQSENEPYDCTEPIGYKVLEIVYTLKNGIISSRP